MRVILKPAGLMIVGLAFLGLVGVVGYDRYTHANDAQASVQLDKIRTSLATRLREGKPVIPATLHPVVDNPGFEGGYEPIPPRAPGRGVDTTHRGGEVAFPWRDDSDWADVSVSYSKETTSVHSGKAAQRVLVQAVRSGAVQMVQEVHPVKGQAYEMSCWFKSDRPLDVEVGLRQEGSPFTYYGQTKATIGTNWQKVSLVVTSNRRDAALFVVKLLGPSNLLMDDADLKPVDTKVQ